MWEQIRSQAKLARFTRPNSLPAGAVVIALSALLCLAKISLAETPTGNDATNKAPRKQAPPTSKNVKSEAPAQAESLVKDALYHEIYGDAATRNRLLENAISIDPTYAPSLWQSGMVQFRGRWLKFDEVVNLAAKDSHLVRYVKLRDGTRDSEAGNLQLADWCQNRRLEEQARAHYESVLQFNPDNLRARTALGYRRFKGTWLTQAAYEKQISETEQRTKVLAEWLPRVTPILNGMMSDDVAVKKSAKQQFSEINDVASIPALEIRFSLVSEEISALLIEKLASWNDARATEGIMRQAVLSPSEDVRHLAATKLHARPKPEYVPQLLAALRSPVILFAGSGLFGDGGPKSYPVFRELLVREGPDSVQAHLRSSYYQLFNQNGDRNNRNVHDLAKISADIKQMKVADATAVNWENFQSDEVNNRIMDALANATGQTAFTRPDDWRAWWSQENEFESPQSKSFYLSSIERDVFIADEGDYSPPTVETTTWHEPIPRIPPASCLVAGTPIWTLTGLKPVESVRVGDVVLSQNVETGELELKPVLRTTVRQPVPVFSIESNSEIITATGGHLFWVAGEGWTKARDLKSGQTLHCAAGTVQVSDVTQQATPDRTYNLVVADFNTYFVGPEKILSHDVTERKPTRSIVPGLPRE